MSSVNDIFGDPIKAPGPAGLNSGSVPDTITRGLAFALNFVFVVAGFILAVQLIWGGLDWVTSGGDEKKLAGAQAKIINSLIGIVIMIAALVIWIFVTSNILGTIKFEDGTIRFDLPSIDNGGSSTNPGGGTSPGGSEPGAGIQPVDPILEPGRGGADPRPKTPFE